MNKNRHLFVLTFGVIIGIIIYAIAFTPKAIQANVHRAAQPAMEQKGQLFPFIWIVLIVGGCIGITLTYVSWRKYRGEKKNKQDKTVD
ncbi:hypothetical protein J32TS6_03500 [Virgibacillus pantothenticus]|uniref:Sporulation protein n=1 Tax=Virgibacillus pantothenticus TaxID=1473 RepID=A0A0L0QP49_VIRPA|nr:MULTISPECIES: sporulation protein YpjB [Virgibacillus]API90394.1 hypothetical protein BKP57_00115 [Virgibacillus sp. 6R]KNE20357.1 hypothetical protein AFK71_18450 [Virgibacillus pantothenticus]MBS7429497.1 hypothetical protein [Virgibacillus sp. 19R1-5]MBU8567869.1 sporulation protein YpjB [Virgibacillus pantothenticus]MBU8601662.1 sporulation protein YpjB [Virgibacillus pantothenticus]